VKPDPDPLDSFCDDDVKVVCTKADPVREVTVACRPYNVKKETPRPVWCPLTDIVTTLATLAPRGRRG